MLRAVSVRFLSVLVLLLTSFFALAQIKPAPSPELEDNDDPAARLNWFMESRRTPDGSVPAAWVNRAMEQKFQLRTQREMRLRQMMQTLSAGELSNALIGNGTTSWTPLGPAPIVPNASQGVNWNSISGRVSAVAVDPSDPTGNTVYIGGATGGVWKSTNAAAADPNAVTWTAVLDQQKTLAVGAIAVSPDGNTVLVGTGEAKTAIDSYYGQGIYQSTDRGATWTLVTTGGSTTGGARTFFGVGVAKIAFNTNNPSVVVAATTSTGFGNATGAFGAGSWSGLWRSTDGGANWTAITSGVTDGGIATSTGAAHSVVYDAVGGKFFAQYRFHGIYQSNDDGLTWTRLDNQPDDTTLLSAASCPAVTSSNCPMYRAEMAVRPGKDELYVFWVGPGQSTSFNHGVWLTTDGGATTWKKLDKTGIDACLTSGTSSEGGCSVAQGYFYNLTIAAIENPSDTNLTDVYVGAVNIFKCTLDPRPAGTASRCQSTNAEPKRFMNITHVYGVPQSTCGFGQFAKIHPDQHAMAVHPALKNLIYFSNDGGVYRTTNPLALNTAVCANKPAGGMPFDSLNKNIGAMTQYVWATPHPTDPSGFIGGSQDNGSSLTSSSITRTSSTNGFSFFPWSGGDGGYNAIRTDLTPNVLYSTFTEVSVMSCSNGMNCTSPDNQVVTNNDLVATGATIFDDSAFYTPWLLDPYDPSKLILGTCRIWRGISTPGPTQLYNGVVLSQKLSNASGQLYCNGDSSRATTDAMVSALAAGGPKSSTLTTATVIYAAVFKGGVSAVWMTNNADALSTWTNVSPAALNPSSYKISSLTINQALDPTGMTVYATIQGFGGAHVVKSVNGGTSWTNISGNLPDAPANTLTIDPDDPTVIYVGTDTGVYVTTDDGTTWTEVGPTLPGPPGVTGFLPNVPVSRLAFSTAGGLRQLMAATYGRGIWVADLTNTNVPQVTFDKASLLFGNVPSGLTSAPQTLKLSNTGSADLKITTLAIGGTNPASFAQTNDCPISPNTLAVGAFCTITVTAHPTTTGALNATVSVTDNAAGSPHNVPLSVTGTTPGVGLEFTTLNFGNVLVNTSSASKTDKLTNNGTAPLTITSIAITGANQSSFSQTNDCPVSPATLAVLGFCTITTKFTPLSIGALTANVTITDDSVSSPQTIALSGTGAVPTIATNPAATVAFGFQKVGTTSASQTVTLSNNGGADLHITNLATSAPFALNANTCAPPKTLAPNANCSVLLTFSPTVTGAAPAANLAVTSDTGNTVGTVTNVSLTGTGETPAVSANPTAAAGLSFNAKPITTSTTATVTLSNTSHVGLAISSVVATGTGFSQTNNCGSSLAGQSNCTITVTFNPTTTGAKNGTLTVISDAPAPNNTLSFALTGTGEDFAQATNASSANVTAGAAASFTLTETPAAGSFTSAISFTCTGLDSTMGCSFNPAQVTPGAAAATTTLTISTRAPSGTATAFNSAGHGGSALLAFLLALPGLAVFVPGIRNQKLSWRKKVSALALLMLVLVTLVAMSGCGGSSGSGGGGIPGTRAGSYTINVVASSGTLQHTSTVTVTVQ